jgi:soluble lytic murein transglycosylase-like protein
MATGSLLRATVAALGAVWIVAAGERPPAAWAGDVEILRGEVRALRERVDALETDLATARRALQAHDIPAAMEFAGQPVPLASWDVAERAERELLLSLGNRGQVALWLKRSARYFPYIETELRRAGLPDDLKYVAVIESSLLPTVYSQAQALGIWQFIPTTGRRYGLAVTAAWDERRDPERSTVAALAYLRDLHAQFRDWPLALAAYNTGENRVEQALRRQGVTSYYQLALSEETERYVFRVFAAKLILADPGRYGLEIPAEQRYRPRECAVVEIAVRGSLGLVELARSVGSFYRELRQLNPEIVQDALPKGRYRICAPKPSPSQMAARDGRAR